MNKVVTRFAPSPTGFIHVGNVRTALFAWLYARQHGGTFILRIEDTDKKREVEGSIERIITSLKWLGIDWDEGVDVGGPHGPYKQSERLPSYIRYAKLLIEKGYAYADPYTEEEVETFRKKAEEEKRPFLYRDHRPETTKPWDGSTSLRFRVPEIKRYEWNDLVRGTLSAGEEALDDFILIKSDGYPTYNFAHIIDDLEMGVTHIMRGQEFISSTPKFLALYDALEIKRPEIATMPVILGEEGGKKMGKRDGAKDIFEYAAEGYLPEAMMNFLALLGWHPHDGDEILSVDELLKKFDVTKLQSAGARFDEDKLLYINQQWMRKLSNEEFVAQGKFTQTDTAILKKAAPLLKERAHTFGEARSILDGELKCLFEMIPFNTELILQKETVPGFTKNALEGILELVRALPDDVSEVTVKEALMPFADSEETKEKGGRGRVLWPLRALLSGAERSPDPFTLISILGKTESSSRIEKALAIL